MSTASGIRWYRSYPSALTQTIVASNNNLWSAADPGSVFPYNALSSIATFTSQQSAPVSFASVRDPAALSGSGSDVLVICGLTGPYGFATATFTLTGTPAAGQVVTVTMVGGATVTASYTSVSSDTLASIASNVVQQVNQSAAVIPGTPYLQQAYFLSPTSASSTITFGALASGTGGNAYTVHIVLTGTGGLSITPSAVTNLSGGGASVSAPLKYDGSTVSGMSSQITQAFTNSVTWHNHVWYWGDPNNPTTLYASDLNEPESFAFMLQNGGYQIGQGDGDPQITAVVPIGNILYVFKTQNIYAITGYDFQSGEYQFSVAPAIQGTGTPNAQSAVVLRNAIVFWSGRKFYRLSPGAFELEYIGRTIPVTQGLASNGQQNLVRAVAGDFVVKSNLNENFTTIGSTATEMYTSVALFACDIGNGVADTIVVYDDDASQYLGSYAWSIWTGWQVGGWIPFGNGMNTSQTHTDQPLLCWCPPPTAGYPTVLAYGTDPAADYQVGAASATAIPFVAQTGWVTTGTAALDKELHEIYLNVEATSGVYFSFTITPSITIEQNGTPKVYNPFTGAFAATGAPVGSEAFQTVVADIDPSLKGKAWIFAFGETSATANYELGELTLDYIEEAFKP